MRRPARTAARIALLSVATAASLTACIAHKPRRTHDYTDVTAQLPSHCAAIQIPATDACHEEYGTAPANSRICTSIDELTTPSPPDSDRRSEVECFSHEKHIASGGIVNLPHDGFDLHVVEFDDEGQPWNSLRVDITLEQLKDELTRPALVVTFVHGWKNDANVCNGNLSCFRDVLEVLAKAEHQYGEIMHEPPRRVIGVYIGWRGGSVSVPIAKQFTFWGRKQTAHTIGDNGGVTAFLRRVRTIVDDAPNRMPAQYGRTPTNQPSASLPLTSLVFVGHSFGAALLFSALSTSLNADVGEAIQYALDSPRSETPPGSRVAADASATNQRRGRSPAQALLTNNTTPVPVLRQQDLVVLVNPAMEGSRFANLNQAAHVTFDRRQAPIFMTLASENDTAVGAFFPIGQSVATLFRSARSRDAWFSMTTGFGLYKPYHTHRLALNPTTYPPLPDTAKGACTCPSNLRAFGDALVLRLRPLYEALRDPDGGPARVEPKDLLELGAYQEFMHSRLEPIRDVDPNNPFLMVSVDRDVVREHSDIFNPRFIDFLIEFIIRTEVKREQVKALGAAP